MRTVDHAAFEQPALARAAGAVAAAIGHADALTDGGGQHRFVACHVEAALGRCQGDGEGHGGNRRRALRERASTLKTDIVPSPPMPSLPHPFRRPTLLIVGCGDIGLRVLRLLRGRWRVLATTSSPQRVPALRAAGALPLVADLDAPATLSRLGRLADAVLHLAPPPGHGAVDTRTQALVAALANGGRVRRLVYGSTSGVYGDAGGACFDETRAVAPASDRARRRVEAEARLRWYGRACGVRVTILRIPGIYALDRPGGDPRERLKRGTPVLHADDDVHTNHIHADDLARACIAALHRGLPQRVLHASDDSALKMGDYFDQAADMAGLARPPRVTREEAGAVLTPMQLSFLSESRRLDNRRLKAELRLRLRYPTVADGLAALKFPARV
ncbi:MAG: NAD(P)H-binding protein [Burkholderiales bacterium]|nr:NAD(P)H-binding protein [Burkholderiales bacterium]